MTAETETPTESPSGAVVEEAEPASGPNFEEITGDPRYIERLSVIGQQRLRLLLPPPGAPEGIVSWFFGTIAVTVAATLLLGWAFQAPEWGLLLMGGSMIFVIVKVFRARRAWEDRINATTFEPVPARLAESCTPESRSLRFLVPDPSADTIAGGLPAKAGKDGVEVTLAGPPRAAHEAGAGAIITAADGRLLELLWLDEATTKPAAEEASDNEKDAEAAK